MSDTEFRRWMELLCAPDRDCPDRPEWPSLFRKLMSEELRREQEVNRPYSGNRIIINRLNHDFAAANSPEKRATYGLYHRCLRESEGRLSVGSDVYWLLSYEVPNQGNEKGRRADLIALTREGGLRVFESKLPENNIAPVAALMEGLDYLACLTGVQNFGRCLRDFDALRAALPSIPVGFENVRPSRTAQPGVIVLAPREYFRKYSRSRRGAGWKDIAEAGRRTSDCVELGFAAAELDHEGFFSRDVIWADVVVNDSSRL